METGGEALRHSVVAWCGEAVVVAAEWVVPHSRVVENIMRVTLGANEPRSHSQGFQHWEYRSP